MAEKKYKQDNKAIKEATRIELSNKLIQVCSKILTNLEQEVLRKVLLDDKTFAEIADERQLTSGRIKQIFQKAIKRLTNFIGTIDEKLSKYNEVVEKYSEMEALLNEYKKEENLRNTKKNIIESFPKKIQKLLQTKISDTILSARVKNICENGNIWGEGVKTIEELIQLGSKNLLKYRNCGKKSIDEIDEFFKKNNLDWKMLDAN